MSNTTTTTTTAALGSTVAGMAGRLSRTTRSSRLLKTSASGRAKNEKPAGQSSVGDVGDVMDETHVIQPTMKPTVTCRRCSDLGWVRADVELGHADFGRAIRCSCKADEDRVIRAKRAQQASNLSGRLLTKTFETFDCGRSPEAAEACFILRQFAAAPEGWVLLIGTRGTGKTHLLAAVANALMALGRSPLYVVVPDFLDYLRAGYDSEKLSETASRRMANARECPVLLLDDLGVEKRSPWSDEQMYRLLNHRYNEGLPTVIASNVLPHELEPRIASRMRDRELSQIVTLAGEDQRIASGGDGRTKR